MIRRKRATVAVPIRKSADNTALRTVNQLRRALAELHERGRRPEENVRASARAVLDAVANVPCAILIANNRGRYVTVNDAAVTLTGYSRAELLRMSVSDLTPAPRADEGQTLWRRFLEDGRMRGIYDIQRKDGSSVRVEFVALANVVEGLHLSALIRPGTASAASVVKRGVRKNPR